MRLPSSRLVATNRADNSARARVCVIPATVRTVLKATSEVKLLNTDIILIGFYPKLRLRGEDARVYNVAAMTDRTKKRLRARFFRALGPNAVAFKAMMDAAPLLCFYMKDDKGRIMALNRRNCDVCNIKDEWDAIGLRSDQIFPSPYAEDYMALDKEVLSTGKPVLQRVTEYPADRSMNFMISDVYPLYDDAGRIIGTARAYRLTSDTRTDSGRYGHMRTVSRYIAEHYGIPDHRGEAAYANWERDHRIYTGKKNEALRAQKDLYRLLMLLERDAVDAALFVRDPALFRDGLVLELLRGLGVDADACGEDAKLILIRNGGERAVVLNTLPKQGETVDTAAGALTVGESLSLDGMALTVGGEDADLHVCVLRGGEAVADTDFRYVYDESRSMITQYGADEEE